MLVQTKVCEVMDDSLTANTAASVAALLARCCSAPIYSLLLRTNSVEANFAISMCTFHRTRVAAYHVSKGGRSLHLSLWGGWIIG